MELKKPDKGLIVSCAAHAGLLVLALVGFWQAPKFDDAAESVPVDMISESQFQQITKGEKPGKDPKPAIKAVKPAEIADIKPDVPVNPVVKDTPPPPPMRPRIDPPEDASEPAPPPAKIATPQPKPEPPAPPPVVRPVEPTPKPVPPPPVVRAPDPPKPPPPEAEVITPKPVPRPDPVKPVAAVPDPPRPPPKPVAPKQPDPPPVPDKPKLAAKPDKPVLDQVASLLDASKPDPAATPNPDATPKPKHIRPPPPVASAKPFDPSAINSLLQANASTSKPSASPAAAATSAAGLPTARASKMSQNMSGQFAGLVSEHYARCWDQSALNTGISYRPLVRVHFRQNGTLAADPVLANQPGDGQARAMADSALRAIRNCGPVPIPPSLLPFYDEWKDSVLKMTLDGDA